MCRRDEAATADSLRGGRATPGEPPSRQGLCLRCCQATCHVGLEAVVGASAVEMEKQSPALCDGVPAQWVSTWGRGDMGHPGPRSLGSRRPWAGGWG